MEAPVAAEEDLEPELEAEAESPETIDDGRNDPLLAGLIIMIMALLLMCAIFILIASRNMPDGF